MCDLSNNFSRIGAMDVLQFCTDGEVVYYAGIVQAVE